MARSVRNQRLKPTGPPPWFSALQRPLSADAGWLSLLSSVVVLLGCGLFVWGLAVLLGDAILWLRRHLGQSE